MATRRTTRASKTKTLRYDVAKQLRTFEEMAAYLDAWLTEVSEDAAGIARALGDIACARHDTGGARRGIESRKP